MLSKLDLVVDLNCSENLNRGLQILEIIIEDNNILNYVPFRLFRSGILSSGELKHFNQIVFSKKFHFQERWQMNYFAFLSDEQIRLVNREDIVKPYYNIASQINLSLKPFFRHTKIHPDLIYEIMEVIYKRNDKEELGILIDEDAFSFVFNHLTETDELIEKSYLQQLLLRDHFDIDFNVLAQIVNLRTSFLLDYFRFVKSNRLHVFDRYKSLGFVWKIDKIETVLKSIFESYNDKIYSFDISKHDCVVFFRNLDETDQKRANIFLLDFLTNNYKNVRRVNIVVNIGRNTNSSLFREILIQYITLNQDVDMFSKIGWRDNFVMRSGDVNFGDIEASEWQDIFDIVNESCRGLRFRSIKNYILVEIENGKSYAESEKLRRFITR